MQDVATLLWLQWWRTCCTGEVREEQISLGFQQKEPASVVMHHYVRSVVSAKIPAAEKSQTEERGSESTKLMLTFSFFYFILIGFCKVCSLEYRDDSGYFSLRVVHSITNANWNVYHVIINTHWFSNCKYFPSTKKVYHLELTNHASLLRRYYYFPSYAACADPGVGTNSLFIDMFAWCSIQPALGRFSLLASFS